MKFFISSIALLVEIVFTKGDDGPNMEYLGSKPSKAYHFPWLVTFHKETTLVEPKEFVGSGSILTVIWTIGSMDSFVRWSTGSILKNSVKAPFYTQVDHLYAYSGGIWGQPYIEGKVKPLWYQKGKVREIRLFSDPKTVAAHVEMFARNHEPTKLNKFKRSPFGLSMSLCLVKVSTLTNQHEGAWVWKRVTLPIPLLNLDGNIIAKRLQQEFERYEKYPHELECFVGGWRLEDKRLVQHQVVYVPHAECQTTYCSWDDRACLVWPVKGVHVCFRSVKFTEVCPLDQGSALFCRAISNSVVAVLTSAPTCGHGGLPGVYTVVNEALYLYERIWPLKPFKNLPESNLESLKFTPPPEESLIPVHT